MELFLVPQIPSTPQTKSHISIPRHRTPTLPLPPSRTPLPLFFFPPNHLVIPVSKYDQPALPMRSDAHFSPLPYPTPTPLPPFPIQQDKPAGKSSSFQALFSLLSIVKPMGVLCVCRRMAGGGRGVSRGLVRKCELGICSLALCTPLPLLSANVWHRNKLPSVCLCLWLWVSPSLFSTFSTSCQLLAQSCCSSVQFSLWRCFFPFKRELVGRASQLTNYSGDKMNWSNKYFKKAWSEKNCEFGRLQRKSWEIDLEHYLLDGLKVLRSEDFFYNKVM